jgi:hypothetical protein
MPKSPPVAVVTIIPEQREHLGVMESSVEDGAGSGDALPDRVAGRRRCGANPTLLTPGQSDSRTSLSA